MIKRLIGGTVAMITFVALALLSTSSSVPHTSDIKLRSVTDTPVTIMGAGDIAESGTDNQLNATSTGDLIRNANPAAVFTLGDNAYNDGSATDYATKYDPTWGSFKAKTHPAPGNHEYHAVPPQGYLDYFGQANVSYDNTSGHVYYAWNVGNGWRAYSLNDELSSADMATEQTWLHNDIVAHPSMHYLGYFHEPRYVSGTTHTDRTDVCGLWNELQGVGGDVLMAGHEHHSERFAKMDCNGTLSTTGMREFVAGTGGNWLYALPATMHVGSQFADATHFAVLKLVLHVNSYDWAYVASGRCFTPGPNTSYACAADTGLVLDSGTQSTNVTLATTPALPALPSGTRHYVANEEAAAATTAALGYNLHDTGSDPAQVNALPYADKAIVWLGEKCPSGATSTFQTAVNALATNPRVFGYYLSDEPSDVNCASGAKAEADYIHSVAPGQFAFLLLTDFAGTYAAYSPANTDVDLVAIDPYPCQYPVSGGCDLSRIDAQVNAAISAGIPRERLVPTFQAFGQTTTWFAPTAAQLQSILDRWATLLPFPVFDFAYTWGCQGGLRTDCISTHADWQNVLRAYNTTFPTGRTLPTSPTNQPPTVNAGPDQSITLPASATLSGTVTDDGLPNPPGATTVTWTKTSGPGTVTFGNANATSTSATFSAAGTYVLRLTASDSALSAFDEVQVTVATAGGGGNTLNRQIATSLDDVEQFTADNSMYVNSSDTEMTYDGTMQQIIGFRFPNITVPQGATITRAWIDYTAKDSASSTCSLTLKAQAADNAAAFTTANNNVGGRTLGAASVAWTPSAWVAETHYQTPEAKTLVQEVVGRAGWVSGNALVVVVSGPVGNGTRNAWAWDGAAAKAATLHIEW